MKTPPINTKFINTFPIFISSTAASLIVYYGAFTAYFAPLMLGIIAGGLVDLDNGLTGKLKNILYALLAFSISSLSIQTTFDQPLLLVPTFTALAFIFTFLGVAGQRYRTIAFGTLAVAVYTSLTHNPDAPWFLNTLLILCGTLLYSGATVLVHLVFPHRPVQESMVASYEALADYLDGKAAFFDPDEADFLEQQQIGLAMSNSRVVSAFNHTRSALFYRMRGQHRHPRTVRMLRYYFAAQDIHERISSSHVRYREFAKEMRHSDLIYRIARLLHLQAAACREFADALRRDTAYRCSEKLTRATAGAEQSMAHYTAQPDNGTAPHRVQRLLDNIMHVSLQFANLGNPDTEDFRYDSKTRLSAPEKGGLKGAWRTMKAQNTFQSPVFRHAVRMAVIVLVCGIIIQLFNRLRINGSDLSLGFWILLTAVFVCQPNYSATKRRLRQRILGTLGGVLVGSALPMVALGLEHKLAIAVLTTTLFFFFRTNKYSSSTFFITIQAMIGFSIMGFDVAGFFVPRIIDTVAGALIATAAVYCLWPDWKYRSLEGSSREAVESNAGYLNAVLDELRHGIRDDMDYRIARRKSHDKAAALSSVLSDMSGEAAKHAAELPDGFLLLKINYSLISHISALGAYRNKIHIGDESERQFLERFFPAAETVVSVLQNFASWDTGTFQAALAGLQQQIDLLRPDQADTGHAQNQVLWQQLLMIRELLDPCYQALKRQQKPNPDTAALPPAPQAA